MKNGLIIFLVLAASVPLSHAAAILSPGDTIIGGARVAGGMFEVGVAGTTAGVNNWPAAEPPEDLINGLIGGGGEKYLNFARLDTGVIVTPTAGPSIVDSLMLWVANDAPERDPASFELWGSNTFAGGTGPFDIAAEFTLVSQGDLALPDERDAVTDMDGLSDTVAIGATEAYASYLVLFPTVKGPEGNSMQVSELQLDGTIIPEPASAFLVALGLGALGLRRRRRG